MASVAAQKVNLRQLDMLTLLTFFRQAKIQYYYHEHFLDGTTKPFTKKQNGLDVTVDYMAKKFMEDSAMFPYAVQFDHDDGTIRNQILLMATLEVWMDMILFYGTTTDITFVKPAEEYIQKIQRCKRLCDIVTDDYYEMSLTPELREIFMDMSNSEESIINTLLSLYEDFCEEIRALQLKAKDYYIYNNNTAPRIFMPFSNTINLLSSNKLLYIEDIVDEVSDDAYVKMVGYNVNDKNKNLTILPDKNGKKLLDKTYITNYSSNVTITPVEIDDSISRLDTENLLGLNIVLFSYIKHPNEFKLFSGKTNSNVGYPIRNDLDYITAKTINQYLQRTHAMYIVDSQMSMIGYNSELNNLIKSTPIGKKLGIKDNTFFLNYPFCMNSIELYTELPDEIAIAPKLLLQPVQPENIYLDMYLNY